MTSQGFLYIKVSEFRKVYISAMKFYDKTFEIIKNTNEIRTLQNNFHTLNKNYSSIMKKNRTNSFMKNKMRSFLSRKIIICFLFLKEIMNQKKRYLSINASKVLLF